MAYLIGDSVKVPEDLVLGKKYGGYLFLNEMARFKEIPTTFSEDCGHNRYSIDIDSERRFFWTSEMLQPMK